MSPATRIRDLIAAALIVLSLAALVPAAAAAATDSPSVSSQQDWANA